MTSTSTSFAEAQRRLAARRQGRENEAARREEAAGSARSRFGRLPFPLNRLPGVGGGGSTHDDGDGDGRRRPAFRVGQVDAELLDEELVELLRNQTGEALRYFGGHLKDDWSAEVLLALRAVLFKLTVWDHDATYGAALQNLRYTDARRPGPVPAAPSRGQKALYGLATVVGRYGWTKWEGWLLDQDDGYGEAGPRVRRLARLTSAVSTAHAAAALASFLVFLLHGRYRTLLDRALGMRLASRTSQVGRDVSFEYLNRQLVWHAFTEFLLFVLPLVGVNRWRRWLARTWKKTQEIMVKTRRGGSGDGDGDDDDDRPAGEYGFLPERTCAICYQDQNALATTENEALAATASGGGGIVGSAQTDITNPYEAVPCGCTYCFVCLANRLDREEGDGWTCLRCGQLVRECRPWRGDVLEPPSPPPPSPPSRPGGSGGGKSPGPKTVAFSDVVKNFEFDAGRDDSPGLASDSDVREEDSASQDQIVPTVGWGVGYDNIGTRNGNGGGGVITWCWPARDGGFIIGGISCIHTHLLTLTYVHMRLGLSWPTACTTMMEDRTTTANTRRGERRRERRTSGLTMFARVPVDAFLSLHLLLYVLRLSWPRDSLLILSHANTCPSIRLAGPAVGFGGECLLYAILPCCVRLATGASGACRGFLRHLDSRDESPAARRSITMTLGCPPAVRRQVALPTSRSVAARERKQQGTGKKPRHGRSIRHPEPEARTLQTRDAAASVLAAHHYTSVIVVIRRHPPSPASSTVHAQTSSSTGYQIRGTTDHRRDPDFSHGRIPARPCCRFSEPRHQQTARASSRRRHRDLDPDVVPRSSPIRPRPRSTQTSSQPVVAEFASRSAGPTTTSTPNPLGAFQTPRGLQPDGPCRPSSSSRRAASRARASSTRRRCWAGSAPCRRATASGRAAAPASWACCRGRPAAAAASTSATVPCWPRNSTRMTMAAATTTSTMPASVRTTTTTITAAPVAVCAGGGTVRCGRRSTCGSRRAKAPCGGSSTCGGVAMASWSFCLRLWCVLLPCDMSVLPLCPSFGGRRQRRWHLAPERAQGEDDACDGLPLLTCEGKRRPSAGVRCRFRSTSCRPRTATTASPDPARYPATERRACRSTSGSFCLSTTASTTSRP